MRQHSVRYHGFSPIYFLIAVTAIATVNPSGMTSWDYLAKHKVLAPVEVARNFFSGGGVMILFGGLISTMSALNATIYSSSRVAFAMGRDHQKKENRSMENKLPTLFLDLAFIAWDLKFLSDLLGEAISLFPRIASAVIIMGGGWFLAVWAASGLLKILLRENVEQAAVIALYARIMLIVLFSAMPLVALDVAGNIVTIGFTTIFITLGVIAIVLVVMQGKALFKKQNGLEGDHRENGGD